jgi:uncharacterized protein (TIGR01777 family)
VHILITGGTGLIGRQLCKALLAEGHELTVLSRNPDSVPEKCGANVHAMAGLEEWQADQAFDAIINLAGEPIVDARWTVRRKQALWDSRVSLTEHLLRRISAARHKPGVLLSGSAVGYYGNRGDAALDEAAPAGGDFAARLCKAWEQAALGAEMYGVRVCRLRTGLVLSRQGGLLGRMLLPFKLGLGARLGEGTQWMSWIHIDDYVAMLLGLLNDIQASGPYNMNAPACCWKDKRCCRKRWKRQVFALHLQILRMRCATCWADSFSGLFPFDKAGFAFRIFPFVASCLPECS